MAARKGSIESIKVTDGTLKFKVKTDAPDAWLEVTMGHVTERNNASISRHAYTPPPDTTSVQAELKYENSKGEITTLDSQTFVIG